MRIKLILDTANAIKKRKLWYLFDKSTCRKVADISYLIKKRFYSYDGNISLSLDGFLLPLQEDVNIIEDNDVITVAFTPESTERVGNANCPVKKRNIQDAASSTSSADSDTSSSETDGENKLSKKTRMNKYRKNPSNGLSSTNENKAKPPAKKTKIKSSTKPSDVLKKEVGSNNIPNILTKVADIIKTKTNVNTTTTVPTNVISRPAKAIPLSKLGITKVKQQRHSSTDSTDSSSSSEEERKPIKKNIVPADSKKANIKPSVLNNKKNDNERKVKTIKKPQPPTTSTRKSASSTSSDSSDSSSDSSADKSNHVNKEGKANIDFNISKSVFNKKTDTNTENNNKPSGIGNSKAKKMASKDVYKNKSEFITSQPFTMVKIAEKLNGECLITEEVKSGYSNSKDFISLIDSNNDNISGKTLRNRRRNQIRKENMKKRQLLEKDKVKDEVEANESTVTVATNGDKVEDITLDNEPMESILIEDDTKIILDIKPSSKNYDSFVKLTEPPVVGSLIAYKILEMSPIHYTPEISDYKEACVKSYDKETNILELEVTEESQCTNGGDSQVKGKFEMPDISDEEDLSVEPQNTVSMEWHALIEPCLLP